MSAIPLISHPHPDSVFACRAGQPILSSQFLRDVAYLARHLPNKRQILNLCTDRYRFAVGFAAALLRQQINLLPPNYTPSFVAQLLKTYPDMYCLADGEVTLNGIEVMNYPFTTSTAETEQPTPLIPSAQLAALVFTSGSTGQPVPHPKTWGSLCKGALAEAASLGIKQNSGLAILGTVPSQHMYGLESCVLLPMQNGLTLVAEKPFYPADISGQLSLLSQPRCLVTTPVHLRTLLSDDMELPVVEFVLCATAHLAPRLASKAETRFAAPLYEIYGFTEAGQVASRRTTQSTHWKLMPGVELLQDKRGSRMRGGHIEIEAPMSDLVERNPDGTFTLHGRTADLVNIAGKRTSLASLNHHLNEIPGVIDGAFLIPDDSDGELRRPVAFVVAPGLRTEDILNALRKTVDAAFLPRPIYFVETLARNSTGKLTRDALMQLVTQCVQ